MKERIEEKTMRIYDMKRAKNLGGLISNQFFTNSKVVQARKEIIHVKLFTFVRNSICLFASPKQR